MIKLAKSPVVFDEANHRYYLGDRRLSGITSLIHQVLQLGTYPDASDYVKNVAIPRAGEYGSAVHHAIETYDEIGVRQTISEGRFGTWDVSAELDCYISNKVGYTSLANEYTVSDNERYASNIDNIWLKDDTQGIWLIDTKTNNLDLYPGGEDALQEYLSWQLSIYAYLFERQNPDIKVEGLACNWLRKGDSRFWNIERKPDEQVVKLLSVPWAEVDGFIVYDGFDVAAELIGNKVATIPQQSIVPQQVIQMIYQLEVQAKEAEIIAKEMKAKLREAMENNGIKSWDAGVFKATIAADSVTTTFDTRRFKADHPDLYEQYTKQTAKKGGFTIKLRD